ncbi:hypothetical protein SI65_08234 [Aspergillus cristatus]|uniref:Uncharacterized protein n=1 Tax=Aspergillus cristatus TaxID=573508 RepID=A0A1E3B5I8_ASPCR|nr:hypothetical protein SI65_08234 [Aspergillus cristatus]
MAITSLDMNPKFSASNPSMNKRWPPLADKTSLPYKLTSLSRQKLAREATAPNPDIRRCLGHFRLHCSSMEWAQKDMTTRINSFEMEDDDEDEEEEVQQQQEEKEDKRTKELPLLGADHEDKNKVKGRKDDEDEEGSDRKQLHVRFQISVKPSTTTTTPSQSSSPSQSPTPSSPSSPSDKETENAKDGLLEKGISCIEKTRQHFWSNPAQCLPIRIAS